MARYNAGALLVATLGLMPAPFEGGAPVGRDAFERGVSADVLDDALFKLLDADEDGKLSRSELAAAPGILSALGQEAAAGPAGVPVPVKGEQVQVPLDVERAQRRGLRNCDAVDVLGSHRCDRKILQRPLEFACGVSVQHPVRGHIDSAVDLHVVRILPQARHSACRSRRRTSPRIARFEQQRITLGAEFVGFHLLENIAGRVDCCDYLVSSSRPTRIRLRGGTVAWPTRSPSAKNVTTRAWPARFHATNVRVFVSSLT